MNDTARSVGELPIVAELEDPDWGGDLGWITCDLFARPYQGLLRTVDGDVVVYRNSDLAALARHPAVGHQPVDVITDSIGVPNDPVEAGLARFFGNNVFAWLPPRHRPAKQLVSRLLMPASVARFASDFAEIVGSLVDDATGREVDVVADLARPAVAAFWCRALGFRADEASAMIGIANRVAQLSQVRAPAEVLADANAAGHEFMDAMEEVVARSARDGGYPLASELVEGHAAAEELAAEDPFAMFGAALLDGFHTLPALLGAVVAALLEAGLQPAAGEEDPLGFATAAYQEGTRLHPPIPTLSRRTSDVVEHDGALIPAGTNVRMTWIAGNRDPEVFEDPAVYRLERPGRVRQVTFGGGLYVCPGRNLAQALAELFLAELVGRSVSLEESGAAVWASGSSLHELRALPVVLTRP